MRALASRGETAVHMGWSSEWEAACEAARRRQFRVLLGASLVLHLLVATALAFVPEPSPPPLLTHVISIDLLSMPGPPAPRPAARPKPEPVRPAKIVLPKEAPAVRERPEKVKPVMRPPRPKEMEYGEALAQLRSELGEVEPEVPPAEAEVPEAQEAEAPVPGGGVGVPVSREMLAWQAATKRHVRSRYVTPPEFLNRSLVTDLRVVLSADGAVVGIPEVVRSSGDPFWDDNAVRALIKASPLPPPPEPGAWPFRFPSEDRW